MTARRIISGPLRKPLNGLALLILGRCEPGLPFSRTIRLTDPYETNLPASSRFVLKRPLLNFKEARSMRICAERF